MQSKAQSRIHLAAPRIADTSEMHNASVDEDAVREGVCGQLHLPTGRMCTLSHGHGASCEFLSADAAYASRAQHRTGQRR